MAPAKAASALGHPSARAGARPGVPRGKAGGQTRISMVRYLELLGKFGRPWRPSN